MNIPGKPPYINIVTRLRRFWADNPGEELTTDDIARKFSVSPRSAGAAIRTLHKSGMPMERVSVYRPKEKR